VFACRLYSVQCTENSANEAGVRLQLTCVIMAVMFILSCHVWAKTASLLSLPHPAIPSPPLHLIIYLLFPHLPLPPLLYPTSPTFCPHLINITRSLPLYPYTSTPSPPLCNIANSFPFFVLHLPRPPLPYPYSSSCSIRTFYHTASNSLSSFSTPPSTTSPLFYTSPPAPPTPPLLTRPPHPPPPPFYPIPPALFLPPSFASYSFPSFIRHYPNPYPPRPLLHYFSLHLQYHPLVFILHLLLSNRF
jgi:hypothetical protein